MAYIDKNGKIHDDGTVNDLKKTSPPSHVETTEDYVSLVDDCNKLAIIFYGISGYSDFVTISPDYKMYEGTHPQEMKMWNMAVEAYKYIDGYDIEKMLNRRLEEDYL